MINIQNILKNIPADWLKLTTHRLDIYNEPKAKVEFLAELKKLENSSDLKQGLLDLPTAFDYIRLGHPLSCVLEYGLAHSKKINDESVITFSSQVMGILAILRKNLLENKSTDIFYKNEKPKFLNEEVLKSVYNYNFNLVKLEEGLPQSSVNTKILITDFSDVLNENEYRDTDFIVATQEGLGSVILCLNEKADEYISEIQHVRRRESIAMTPQNCLSVLENLYSGSQSKIELKVDEKNRLNTIKTINEITSTSGDVPLGSCGLSIQYSIMMGLVHHAQEVHPGKKIKFIVPPNCYGGTNDQARRVAACRDDIEILDLPVDSGQNMVQSVERVLGNVAEADAIPYIIAEIPTNPRVEVPEMEALREALIKERMTKEGKKAIAPVFILDQTFCPNLKFLKEDGIFEGIKTISYVSGSKFPSGGLCTAGYCVANNDGLPLIKYVDSHLKVTDNGATSFQVETLAAQMPSMLERIAGAYKNTRAFVDHIQKELPASKINFVNTELAADGFTPSVFSLDLPTKGNTPEEKENYKRELNHILIRMMIDAIPDESKHCVSYGQLKGCYWTIPATSTQGTTKEGDKDYIVRVAVSPEFNLVKHNEVFTNFCREYYG